MSATPLPWTEVSRNGATPAAEVAGDTVNGHVANNDGNVEIIVHNTNAGSTAHTVTFAFATAFDGQAITPRAFSIAAGVTKKFHGFPQALYGSVIGITVDHAELHLSAEHKVGVAN